MKILGPPSINKKLVEDFDVAICVSEQEKDAERTGLDTNGVYTPNDLESNNKIGWYIVVDTKFVTELVE